MVTCITSSGLQDSFVIGIMAVLYIMLSVIFRNQGQLGNYLALVLSVVISLLLAFTIYPIILAFFGPICGA